MQNLPKFDMDFDSEQSESEFSIIEVGVLIGVIGSGIGLVFVRSKSLSQITSTEGISSDSASLFVSFELETAGILKI